MNAKMKQCGDLRGVFTNYSTEYYKDIIMEAYEEAGIDPCNVAYIEADGSAIKVLKRVICYHKTSRVCIAKI